MTIELSEKRITGREGDCYCREIRFTFSISLFRHDHHLIPTYLSPTVTAQVTLPDRLPEVLPGLMTPLKKSSVFRFGFEPRYSSCVTLVVFVRHLHLISCLRVNHERDDDESLP